MSDTALHRWAIRAAKGMRQLHKTSERFLTIKTVDLAVEAFFVLKTKRRNPLIAGNTLYVRHQSFLDQSCR